MGAAGSGGEQDARHGWRLRRGGRRRKAIAGGTTYAYNVKSLRDQERQVAELAEKSYVRFVTYWKVCPPRARRADASTR
ncbi:hypothetical protein GCM10010987_63650 [Bradyrhizobium guangdongense]|uniref:Uncharacterized protein n=1 Tax=Bradyrhizobium guangdongense TaxID=1325090 RepID=A0AA87W9C1_9BRAD|nr:hypothetical protein GCM10010987_63650 [Bradyrhizobium guangdongense]